MFAYSSGRIGTKFYFTTIILFLLYFCAVHRIHKNIFLGLGSNIGNRAGNLRQAIRLLAEIPEVVVVAISPCYETAAWGKTDQPDFLNLVIEIQTACGPEEILNKVLQIEREMGRLRQEHWGPRIIDLDLLLWDQEVVALEQLSIPHPYLHERIFVLKPLADLAGRIKHPVLKKTISELCVACSDSNAMKLYDLDTFVA
jgi:2-amino-4-hydroxy-6-hydroxymethyldihydropteridine diphosphokinase